MAKPKTIAREGDKVKEFSLSSSKEEDNLMKSQKLVGEDGSSDNDPLVTGDSKLMAVRVQIRIASLGHKVELVALIDSGGTRYLISLAVVEGLRMQLCKLKVLVAFQ